MKLLINSQTSKVQPLKFRNTKQFPPTHHSTYDYLSMPGLKLIHISKSGSVTKHHCYQFNSTTCCRIAPISITSIVGLSLTHWLLRKLIQRKTSCSRRVYLKKKKTVVSAKESLIFWWSEQLPRAIILNKQVTWMMCKWYTQIARFMGPTWGSPGSCRSQVGPMLVPCYQGTQSTGVCGGHIEPVNVSIFASVVRAQSISDWVSVRWIQNMHTI